MEGGSTSATAQCASATRRTLSDEQVKQCHTIFHKHGGVRGDDIPGLLAMLGVGGDFEGIASFWASVQKKPRHTGYLLFDEFLELVEMQVAKQQQQTRLAPDSDALDAFVAMGGSPDGSGTVDVEALRDACFFFGLGGDFTQQHGPITFPRFKSLLNDSVNPAVRDAFVRLGAREVDDLRLELPVGELCSKCVAVGLDEARVAKFINTIDADTSGVIDLAEFQQLLRSCGVEGEAAGSIESLTSQPAPTSPLPLSRSRSMAKAAPRPNDSYINLSAARPPQRTNSFVLGELISSYNTFAQSTARPSTHPPRPAPRRRRFEPHVTAHTATHPPAKTPRPPRSDRQQPTKRRTDPEPPPCAPRSAVPPRGLYTVARAPPGSPPPAQPLPLLKVGDVAVIDGKGHEVLDVGKETIRVRGADEEVCEVPRHKVSAFQPSPPPHRSSSVARLCVKALLKPDLKATARKLLASDPVPTPDIPKKRGFIGSSPPPLPPPFAPYASPPQSVSVKAEESPQPEAKPPPERTVPLEQLTVVLRENRELRERLALAERRLLEEKKLHQAQQSFLKHVNFINSYRLEKFLPRLVSGDTTEGGGGGGGGKAETDHNASRGARRGRGTTGAGEGAVKKSGSVERKGSPPQHPRAEKGRKVQEDAPKGEEGERKVQREERKREQAKKRDEGGRKVQQGTKKGEEEDTAAEHTRHVAARKIQAVQRGRIARREVAERVNKRTRASTEDSVNEQTKEETTKYTKEDNKDNNKDTKEDNKETKEDVKEHADDKERHKAAVKIQALQRGRAARKKYRTSRHREVSQQTDAHQHDGTPATTTQPAENERSRDEAAVKIQALHRGRAVRREAVRLREERKTREESRKREEHAAVRIQAVQRGRAARREYTARQAEAEREAQRRDTAATRIQAVHRGRAARRDLAARRGEEQRVVKEEKEGEGSEKKEREKEKAAVKIQSVHRGREARREAER
eukprot:Sspe_Gene.70927::Locus_41918_Transcript_1_2_Confidence_0.750_Length_3091::g.70927::m.70927